MNPNRGGSIATILSAGIGPRIYLAPPDEGGGGDAGGAGAGGDGAGGAAGAGNGTGGADGAGGTAGDGAQPSALAGALAAAAEGAAKPGEPAADDGKVEGKDKVKPAEGEAEKPADDGAPKDVDGNALPEKYEIKMADGVEMDAKLMEVAEPLFREHKMSPAQAQAMTDLYTKVQGEAIAKHSEMVNGWLNEAKADPEIGGAKFEENLAMASKGFQAFGDERAMQILDTYGLGNNPNILRLFTRIGKAMGEGSTILPGSGTGRVSDAQALYPNMK